MMSEVIANRYVRHRRKILTISVYSAGPVWRISFREVPPLVLLEALNTTRNLT